MDDDLPRPKPTFVPLPLDRLGIEDLRLYVGALHAEITRAETEIARKDNMRLAAEAVFKRG